MSESALGPGVAEPTTPPTSAPAAARAAASPQWPGVVLDDPLPRELTGGTLGWLTSYRRYPVFSPRWARERAKRLGTLIVVVVVLLFGSVVLTASGDAPFSPLVAMTLSLLVPLFAGPWLGSLVRRRGWPPRREGAALVAVVLGVALAVGAFNEWLGEPLKQQVAEWTGQVDEKGERKRIALEIGMTIRAADPTETGGATVQPAAPTGTASRAGSKPSLSTHLWTMFAAFVLAGGLALPRWRRERDGLLALTRERELARARAERREAELRLSVLAAQVEPHFLFNTLAGVRSAIATDPPRAAVLVDRLVDYLRATIPRLRADGGADATLGGQVEAARAYLALMAARLPRLSFAVELPPALRDLPFPPLMLISLVENAVKHGVEPKIGPVHVAVSARRLDDGRVEVSVADDGAGFGVASDASAGSGIGLANIRERLRQMHGERAALALRARPEGGVVASLTVPVE